jgi:hypothetical protein
MTQTLETSYQEYLNYPFNLQSKTCSGYASASYNAKINAFEADKVLCRNGNQKVPWIDVNATPVANSVSHNVAHPHMLRSSGELEALLGERTDPASAIRFTKRDPQCRLM